MLRGLSTSIMMQTQEKNMTRNDLLQFLAGRILKIQKNSPILVAIDGVDASGKTTLANELAKYLKHSSRNLIRVSIDDFHNSEEVRYAKGKNSPEGYYFDSFNYEAVIGVLLDPLSSDSLEYQTAVFDYRNNSKVDLPTQKATNDSILLMDGIFLLRPELIDYWDLKVLLDVNFKFTLQRAIERQADNDHIGSEQKIVEKYNQRYIPGQRLYLQSVNPKNKADIVIDNSEFENPKIIKM